MVISCHQIDEMRPRFSYFSLNGHDGQFASQVAERLETKNVSQVKKRLEMSAFIAIANSVNYSNQV
jgi:hypothetical protein